MNGGTSGASNGVTFKWPLMRSGVQIPTKLVATERKKDYRCSYCDTFVNPNESPATNTTITVKCDIQFCKNRFHVSCAHLYDACYFDVADWPDCVFIMCHEHAGIAKTNSGQSRVQYHFVIDIFICFILFSAINIVAFKIISIFFCFYDITLIILNN